MQRTITDYFEELVDNQVKLSGNPSKIEKWKRLAYLMYINKGELLVSSFGAESIVPGVLWKQGLAMEEAIELIYFTGVLDGADLYDSTTFKDTYLPKIGAWITEQQEIFAKENEGVSFDDLPTPSGTDNPDLKIVP